MALEVPAAFAGYVSPRSPAITVNYLSRPKSPDSESIESVESAPVERVLPLRVKVLGKAVKFSYDSVFVLMVIMALVPIAFIVIAFNGNANARKYEEIIDSDGDRLQALEDTLREWRQNEGARNSASFCEELRKLAKDEDGGNVDGWHDTDDRGKAPLNTTTLILWSTYDRDNKLPINPHYCFENDKAKTILYVIFFPGITLLAIFGSFLLFAHYYLNDVVSQLM